MRRIAVIGVGNILMGDEGVGVRVVEELGKLKLPEGVQLIDAGTAIHALMGRLSGFDKLVIVDAIKGGGPPGTIYRITLDEVKSDPPKPFSLHDLGVLETLRVERLIGDAPEEVVIVGIEPERVEPSLELSPLLKGKLPELIRAVLEELKA